MKDDRERKDRDCPLHHPIRDYRQLEEVQSRVLDPGLLVDHPEGEVDIVGPVADNFVQEVVDTVDPLAESVVQREGADIVGYLVDTIALKVEEDSIAEVG